MIISSTHRFTLKTILPCKGLTQLLHIAHVQYLLLSGISLLTQATSSASLLCPVLTSLTIAGAQYIMEVGEYVQGTASNVS